MHEGRGKIAIATALIALLLIPVLIAPPSTTAAPKPPQRGAYWGAWIGDQLTGAQPPWDMSAISRFEEFTGKGLSLIEFSAPFASCDPSACIPYRFPALEMNTIRNYGAIPFFSWGSQSTPMPDDASEPTFSLANLIAGTHDAYIREFAEAARGWGQPFFLRFDWEMNGSWFPWSEGINGNGPGEFVAAWHHVHDIFTEVGATNASWVWCPYAEPAGRLPAIKDYYPGNAYVDWTCLDGYNWAKNSVNSQPWRSFDEIFSASYDEVVRKIAPKKPMLLAEMASGGRGRAKATWIEQMFKVLRTDYRQIRGLIWFDKIDRGVQWPIEPAPAVSKAFARGIHQNGFKANHYQAAAAPIRPPQ